MKIGSIVTSQLRNDAHFQFHTEFRDLVFRQNPQFLKIKPQFDEYQALFSSEDEALKRINKSAITKKIHEADKARDETFSGMTEFNKAMCKHFDSTKRDAALRVQVVLHTYGNVTVKPINEQTSALYNLLQDLKSAQYLEDSEKSGVLEWANELELRNKAFERLVKERFDEAASKSDVVLRQARKKIDESYRTICDIINVYVVLDGAANYETFIKTLNIIISRYGGRAGKRRGGAENQTNGAAGAANDENDEVDVGGGSHGGGSHGGAQYEIALYDPDKHYTEYQVGDLVRMPNGDIYRVKNLGQVHYAPDGENGHLGWEKVD